jgi:hypothetical protein
MEDLIKSLSSVVRAAGSSPEVNEAAAIAAWKYVAGTGMRPHAIATKLEGSTLVIDVRDTIWQTQLTMMRYQLLFRVNSTLGQALVTKLELRVNPKALPVEKPNKPDADILANEVPIELWAAASEIEDKQLRQKFLKAATGMLRRKGK